MNANRKTLSSIFSASRRPDPRGAARLLAGFRAFICAWVALAAAAQGRAQQSLVLSAGQVATLSVTAEGTQPFTYQWHKDGVALPGATGSSYALASVSPADAGTYTVVVANTAGSTVSDAAVLSVQEPPQAPAITLQPVSVSVKEGATVSFVVGVTGSPAPVYRWSKDGVPLADGGRVTGAATASLTLASVTAADAGIYTLAATNSLGTATSSGAVLAVSTSTTTQKGGGKGSSRTTTDGSTDPSSGGGGTTTPSGGLETFEDRVPDGFDVAGYLTRNPKYKKKYTNDPLGAWRYYRDFGIYAGEIYDDRFRALEYLTLYPDVSAYYGADLRVALLHWLSIGIYEGRLGRFP